MKRLEQLQPLSREHHQSLVLSQKAINTAASGDPEAITKLCKEIVSDYPSVWKTHFKIEEESIFQLVKKTLRDTHSKLVELCKTLEQEHRIMDNYYEQMKAGDYSILNEFGLLLKQHTRVEERHLFPLIEDALSTEQLDAVLKTCKKYH